MKTSKRRLVAAPGPLSQRRFALVWCAGLVSLTGDWALRVALPVVVLQLTGSIAATSGVVVATVLPSLAGPVAGVFVDRWCRRRVLVVANVLQALTVLPLLAVQDASTVWIVYVVAFVAASLSQFVLPAENALLPSLVDPDALPAANALNAVNNNLARLIGPAVGGLVAAWSGLAAVALVDAGTFVVAAGLVALVRGRYAADRDDRTAERHPLAAVRHELAEGFHAIRRNRVVFVIIAVFTGISVGEGIMGSLMAVYVTDYLHGGTAELGWLMSAQAVGGIAGGVLSGWIVRDRPPVRVMSVAGVVFGLIDLALFTYPWIAPVLWPGLVCFVLAGVPAVVMSSTAMTMMQTATSDTVRGRVFAAMGTSMGLAQLLGAGLAGAFAEHVGASTLLVVQAVGLMAAGVALSRLLRAPRAAGSRRQPGHEQSADDLAVALDGKAAGVEVDAPPQQQQQI